MFARVWFLVMVVVTAGCAQYHAAFPAFAAGACGLSTSGLGNVFAINAMTVVAVQLVVLRLMEGRRRTRGFALSSVFIGAAWLTTLVGAQVGAPMRIEVFAVAMALFGLGETLLSPSSSVRRQAHCAWSGTSRRRSTTSMPMSVPDSPSQRRPPTDPSALTILDQAVEPDHPTLVTCRALRAELRSTSR